MEKSTMKQQVSLCLHAVALAHHLYVIKYVREDLDFSKTNNDSILDLKRYESRYFTGWNMVAQTIYLCIAFAHDVLQIYPKNNKSLLRYVDRLKGYIFSSFVFPYTLFVAVMFWTIYAINREWVLPVAADIVIPKWLNHSLHTIILLVVLMEIVLTNQLLPSFKSAFIGMTLISGVYHFVLIYTYFQCGRWLYGLFQVLNWNQRVILMFVNYLSTVFVLKLGMVILKIKGTTKKTEELKSN